MKVLIVANIDSSPNPYVRTLYKGLIANGCNVTCSINDFWEKPLLYDIIHIQWPNSLAQNISKLEKHLKWIKAKKIKIVVTCHNIVPHYSTNNQLIKTYKIVYTNADCIIHLAEYSISLLCKEYSITNTQHVVIPHHIYDNEYHFNISKEEARKYLSLPQEKKIIVCIGAFRNKEERDLVIDTAKKIGKNYLFLCPSFCIKPQKRKNLIKLAYDICKYIKVKIQTLIYPIIINKTGFVSDKELPYYLAASDVAFIHRIKILNSGNLPLAFYAGKPVVGPNAGNVGYLLKMTNNITFDINHTKDIPTIIESITDDNIGKQNKKIAMKLWSVNIVSMNLKKLYSSLYNEKETNI